MCEEDEGRMSKINSGMSEERDRFRREEQGGIIRTLLAFRVGGGSDCGVEIMGEAGVGKSNQKLWIGRDIH